MVTIASGYLYLLGSVYNSYYYDCMGIPQDLIDLNPLQLMTIGSMYGFTVVIYVMGIMGIIFLIGKSSSFKIKAINAFSLNEVWSKWMLSSLVIGVLFIGPLLWVGHLATRAASKNMYKLPSVSVTTKSSRILPENLHYVAYGKGDYVFLKQPQKDDGSLEVVVVPADDIKSLSIYSRPSAWLEIKK